MSDNLLLVRRQERIATISINRPEKRNALNREMWAKLAEIFDNLSADREIAAVILRGEGREVFSAGADIAEFDQGEPVEVRVRAQADSTVRCLRAMRDCPKAVLAMVFGFAMGGGCALALACDLRLAAESAKFGVPAAKLGIVYTPQSTASLVHLVGPANAARILYSGAAFDATTCLQMGLATVVYPDDRLEEETYRLARQIAQNAPLSIAGAKKTIQATLADPSFAHSPEVFALQPRSFASADHKEGVRAFMEKRRPVFRGE